MLRLFKKMRLFSSKTIPVYDITETEISRQTFGKANYKKTG